MPDLDFGDLRRAVEGETSIPEFREVRRRARRVKRWRSLAAAARVLGVLIVAAPALAVGDVVLTHVTDPTSTRPNHSHNGGGSVAAVGNQMPVTRSVVAVDGIDAAHTYALVDVCRGQSCNLQLAQVDPSSPTATVQESNLLRSSPTDQLNDLSVVVENSRTVIISGAIGKGPLQQLSLTVTAAGGRISSAERPLQTNVQGPIDVVSGSSGSATALTNQPPVSQPVLVSTAHGWWVMGTMPDGDMAVSVSRDNGIKWTTHSVGVRTDSSTGLNHGAALATSDGQYVLLLVRSGNSTRLLFSADGGTTWDLRTTQSWPPTPDLGLTFLSGGSLVTWFASGAGTTFLASNDLGVTFHKLAGAATPTGPVLSIGGQFVTLGLSPMTSHNGVAWQSAYVPYLTPSE
ncbi:MAG TPA: sialidase family protein [Micromonosporaceae bacterium]